MPLSPGYSLEYGCTTIADPNRVAQYVANAQDLNYCAGGVNRLAPAPFALTSLKVNCGCPALQYSSPGVGLPPVLIPPYTTPEDDLAPWYSPNDPESAFFYGFMVESIEDLHTAPVKRDVQNRVGRYGGATLGSLRRQPRIIKVTVLGFGNNESALNYGFRWLADTLTFQCDGSDCSLCDLTLRTSCPDLSTPPTYEEWDSGRWTFKDVGIVDGPKMVDPPIEAAACNVRRYEFTLAASSPYAFKCPIPCIDGETFIPAVDPCPPEAWICGEDATPKACCYVTNSSVLGEEALLIDVQAVQELSNLRITITPDQFGYVCGEVPAPAGFVPPEPCAEILIPTLPAGYRITMDTSVETIKVTLPGGLVRDGTAYLDTDDGYAPTFPTLRCGSFCVCVTADRSTYEANNSVISISTIHRELAV
jgi:hypothetical protein